MTGRLLPFDLAVLLAYLAGVVGFGCWFVRRSRSTGEFMAAGGALPGWAVGLSILGTYVSSISFLANPGKSFLDNWNPFVFSLSLPIAAWIAVRWFVPFYRRGGAISAYNHLEHRFGPWARTFAVGCFLLMQLARVASILLLVALALVPVTGWDVRTTILVTGVLVTFYTLLGGIEAVIWTDVVQSVVLTLGMAVAVVVLLTGMPQGPQQLFDVARAHEKFSLGSFAPALGESTFWVVLAFGLFVNLKNFGIDQSYVQRYITARSEADAKRSVWLGALAFVPVSAVLLFIGTGLFAYYQVQPEPLPTAADGGVKADAVFPHFIVHEFPPGLTGLLIAAVLAAAMSSVDSSLNCSATLVLCDVYRRYFRPRAGERESMGVLYVSTLAWGALGTGLALAMIPVESVLDSWWILEGIFSGGMLGLFLLGLLARRAGSPAAACGVIAGSLVILWIALSRSGFWPDELAGLRSPLHRFLAIVAGTTTIVLLGAAVGRLAGGEERKDQ